MLTPRRLLRVRASHPQVFKLHHAGGSAASDGLLPGWRASRRNVKLGGGLGHAGHIKPHWWHWRHWHYDLRVRRRRRSDCEGAPSPSPRVPAAAPVSQGRATAAARPSDRDTGSPVGMPEPVILSPSRRSRDTSTPRLFTVLTRPFFPFPPYYAPSLPPSCFLPHQAPS